MLYAFNIIFGFVVAYLFLLPLCAKKKNDAEFPSGTLITSPTSWKSSVIAPVNIMLQSTILPVYH